MKRAFLLMMAGLISLSTIAAGDCKQKDCKKCTKKECNKQKCPAPCKKTSC